MYVRITFSVSINSFCALFYYPTYFMALELEKKNAYIHQVGLLNFKIENKFQSKKNNA